MSRRCQCCFRPVTDRRYTISKWMLWNKSHHSQKAKRFRMTLPFLTSSRILHSCTVCISCSNSEFNKRPNLRKALLTSAISGTHKSEDLLHGCRKYLPRRTQKLQTPFSLQSSYGCQSSFRLARIVRIIII